MTDYAKFCGLFKLHNDIVLEDCSFIINMWVFSIMIKFVSMKWLKAILNFKKIEKPKDPSINFIENLHAEFVFKFKFK